MRITSVTTHDIRFPTSKNLDGSDAINKDPDYSAAYAILHTDDSSLSGHGLTFTLGRGNDICQHAIDALAPLVVGKTLEELTANMGKTYHMITNSDTQLRWIGPEKGAIHLAAAALINAIWDLWAKVEGKPLWKLVADMSAEELHRCIDFTYISDAVSSDEALEILKKSQVGKEDRMTDLVANGYPAYTTSAGWLGYDDDKLRRLCQEAVDAGWTHIKLKVGVDLQDDIRRCSIAREVIGDDRHLMIDANQIWDVGEAIEWVKQLQKFKPWFIEEPTSPDDILGHKAIKDGVAPTLVATGEHCHNRVMFKQFLQAGAIDVVQIDSCRLAGVNEVIAVMLMAHKFGKPVCPHAGGVGLCEYVQHLSMIDYVCISGSHEGRVAEFVDHLHEHFVNPCVVENSRYVAPSAPGYSIEMKPESIAYYSFPNGTEWKQ